MSLHGKARLLGGLSAVVLIATALLPPAAGAQSGSLASVHESDFYTPPADFASIAPKLGDIIRAEPMPVALSVPGLPGPIPVTDARRIMYRSTASSGAPIAVTGMFMKSTIPWTGAGPRPLAVVAPGTQGQGDNCAPSKTFQTLATIQTTPPSMGAGYDLLTATSLLSAGFNVAVTDYEGLGTPGVHTYINRLSEGHTVLDVARAAIKLTGSGHADDTPVVFTGYSQGGGASASAAELKESYAPELNAVGAAAGAPPADKTNVLDGIDGSTISGAIGYAINSILSTHPHLRPVVETQFNDRGREMLNTVATQCIPETLLQFGLQHTSSFTSDGRPLSAVIADMGEVTQILEDQRIGRIRPSMPIRLQSNIHDDVIDHRQVEQLNRDWCELGAQVDFRIDDTPSILARSAINHMVPMLTHLHGVTSYLLDRVNGVPVAQHCVTSTGPAPGSS